MGKVKEAAYEKVRRTAQLCGKDEQEQLNRWNKNLMRPEGAVTLEEFLYNMTKK